MREEILQFKKLSYIIRFPKGYEQGKKYPIIVFLHGAGSRGTDIEVLRNNPYFMITEGHEDFNFITVAPQCFADTWFDVFETLRDFVRFVVDEAYADRTRVYLMGASMGGYATWQLAMSMPEYFAAICPICGGGMYWNAGRLVNVPVWAFHGKLDNTVCVDESVRMVDSVNCCGGKAELTIYPDNGHDAWSDTYRSIEVFEWLLSHENSNTVKLLKMHNGSRIYG